MLLKPLTKFGAAQQWNTRIILNLVARGNLSARHALLKDSRRQVGARRINGGSIARGAAADNRNIDCLIGSHEESSHRNVVVLCAHTQIYVNVTLMHYNNKPVLQRRRGVIDGSDADERRRSPAHAQHSPIGANHALGTAKTSRDHRARLGRLGSQGRRKCDCAGI